MNWSAKGERALAGLRDVDGVIGAFVAGPDGDILHRNVSAKILPAQLQRTAARLSRVLACARLCDLEVQGCTLKLAEQQLRVEELKSGLLCVMIAPPVNARVLRAALDLAHAALDDPASHPITLRAPSRQTPVSHAPDRHPPSRDDLAESDPTRRDVPAYDEDETTLRGDFSDVIAASRLQR